jgi:hypothetical protein
MPAAGAPPAAPPAPAVKLVKRGIFGEIIEVLNQPRGAFIELPRALEEAAAAGDSGAAARGAAPDAAPPRPRDLAIRGCSHAVVRFREKARAVRIESCEGGAVALPAGAITSVELLRCRRLTLELGAPVSSVRVDDSSDVLVVARSAAARDALLVYTTGSHRVRVAAPPVGEQGAAGEPSGEEAEAVGGEGAADGEAGAEEREIELVE